MEQPSVACFFNSRKRLAVEDLKLNSAKKVLVLDSISTPENSVTKNVNENEDIKTVHLIKEATCKAKQKNDETIFSRKVVSISNNKKGLTKPDKGKSSKNKNVKCKPISNTRNIQDLINNMKSPMETEVPENKIYRAHVTPPSTPTKIVNALDKIKEVPDGPSLKDIKKKLSRSARLAELKNSLSRFQESDNKLKEIEKETKKITDSPKLKTFRTIELEVLTR